MTISTTSNYSVSAGNGLTNSFNFGFFIPLASELYVTYVDINGISWPLTSAQYSVSGIGNVAGGSVTYPLSGVPIATGTSIIIQRIVPIQQLTSLVNQSGYYPNVVEAALDSIVMMIQQLAASVAGALRFPLGDPSTNNVLPPVSSRANNLLGFDSSGNPVAVVPSAQSAAGLQTNLASATGSTLVNGTWFGGVVATLSQFATSIGASLIGFIQAGTGALVRSTQSKLREQFSVTDFGADPTGVADSTVAIQKAIAYAQTFLFGCEIYCPPGQYLLSATLYVTASGVSFKGDGGYATQFIRSTNYGDTIMFSNNGTSSPSALLQFVGVTGILFGYNTAVSTAMTTGAAVEMYACQNSWLRDCIQYNHYDGFSMFGGASNIWDNLYSESYYAMPGINNGNCVNRSNYRIAYLAGANVVNSPAKILLSHCGGNGGFLGAGYPGTQVVNYASKNFGALYGYWITGGEQVELQKCEISGSTVHNLRIELLASMPSNVDIFEVLVEGGYYDTAGFAGIWVGCSDTAGNSRSNCIVNTEFSNVVCKASGVGGVNDGLVIDGTVYTGTYTQAVRGLQVNGCRISTYNRNGIYAVGGVDLLFSNNILKGNNISNGQTGVVTASITSNVMTVIAATSGYLMTGMTLNSAGTPILGNQTFPLLGGETIGGVGRYAVTSANVASSSITGTITAYGNGVTLGSVVNGAKIIGNRIGGSFDDLGSPLTQVYGVSVTAGATNFQIENNDLRLNLTGGLIDGTQGTLTGQFKKITNNVGFNDARAIQGGTWNGGTLYSAATGVPIYNPYGSPAQLNVYNNGGTITGVGLNGVNIANTSTTIGVGASDTVSVTYTGLVAFSWFPQ